MSRRQKKQSVVNERRSRYQYGNGGGAFYNQPSATNVMMIENIYARKFTEMAVNRFTWKGLPDGIDERFIEMTLWRNGLVVFFKSEKYQRLMAMSGSAQGFLDYQDNPTKFNVYGNQLFNALVDAEDAVPVWSNSTRIPDYDVLLWYARRLAEVETTVDINLKNARATRILQVPENMRQTAVNMLRLVDQGEPAVLGTDMMDLNSMIQALDMQQNPESIITIQMAKNRIFNDAMSFLGVNNSNQDKRERMVADEVDANQEMVLLNRASPLTPRKQAAKLINEKFNTNISVDWNEELAPQSSLGDETGVNSNGNVHDDDSGDSGKQS